MVVFLWILGILLLIGLVVWAKEEIKWEHTGVLCNSCSRAHVSSKIVVLNDRRRHMYRCNVCGNHWHIDYASFTAGNDTK